MRKALLIIATVSAAATATAGCGKNRAENGGPTVQRNFPVGAFEEIEVAGSYEVQVRTGSNPSVSASGPEKMIERLVVEVKGGKLLIHPRSEKKWWGNLGGSHGKATVQVTVPMLKAAAIAGSGGIAIDQVRGASFDASVAGSGDLAIESLEVQELSVSVAGSGDVRARSGQARSVDYSIAGSGGIDARGVRSETADVSIAGSGSVSAQATGTADVSIMGSGDVELTGGAKCSVSKAGSGNVRCS
ncbi:MAG TPA: head GIN domain-containing protein [Sphingomicrobium sp.]|nr:head GIN domain-containing protein [Sphingomicrobium sp.]